MDWRERYRRMSVEKKEEEEEPPRPSTWHMDMSEGSGFAITKVCDDCDTEAKRLCIRCYKLVWDETHSKHSHARFVWGPTPLERVIERRRTP